jgi:hypothetical protein
MLVTSEQPEPMGVRQNTADRSELLRQILATQQHREIAYKEAREVGDTLLEFYEVLAEVVNNDPEQ